MNKQTNMGRTVVLNLIGFVLAGTSTFGMNPIGIGYCAALALNGRYSFVTIAAMLLGMLNLFSNIVVVKYLMTLILIVAASKVVQLGKLKVNEYAGAAICFGAVLIIELTDKIMEGSWTSNFFSGETAVRLMIPFMAAVFTAALYIIFSKAVVALLSSRIMYTNEEMFAIAAISGIILYNLQTRFMLPATIVEILMFFTLIFGAYKYGAMMGAVMGVACGIPLSLWQNNAEFLGVMCMVGIMAGIFRELGKFVCAASVLCICVTSGYVLFPLFISDNMVKGLLGACIVFLMLPKNIVFKIEDNENQKEDCERAALCEEKLLMAAKAFEKLSKSIFDITCKNTQTVPVESEQVNQMNLIWKNKLDESREVMSKQLEQISKIIEDYSKQVYNFVRISGEEEELIRYRLRGKKVYMDKIVGIENCRRKKEYLLTAKCEKGVTVGTREISEVISEAMGKPYMPSRNCRKILSNEYTTTTYVEEANFYVLHAAAKKARGESGISGDNYSLRELENGQLLMSLSDGMGYGTSACIESETVIELLEQLLDSGFDGDTALKMINSVMVMNSEEEHPATLDFGVIDLHSGVCDLVKIGAATTFVKRGKWVETIKSTTMPLGMLGDVDYDATSKKLYDGDMIIMVSDGVIDALTCENKDEKLGEIIMNIECDNPKEMAKRILENAIVDQNKLTDDMTVLVTGIWNNNKKIA